MSDARLPAAVFARLYSQGGMAAVEAEVARLFPQHNKLQTLHDKANTEGSRLGGLHSQAPKAKYYWQVEFEDSSSKAVAKDSPEPKHTQNLPKRIQTRSNGEVMLEAQLLEAGLTFKAEYRFVEDRRWRLDFAFPEQRLAVEVQGAVHRIKKRFKSDIEKFNHLTLEGWVILLFRAEHIKKRLAVPLIQEVLERRCSI